MKIRDVVTEKDMIKYFTCEIEDILVKEPVSNPINVLKLRNGKYLEYSDFKYYPYLSYEKAKPIINLYNEYVRLGISKYAEIDIAYNYYYTFDKLAVKLIRRKEDGYNTRITVMNSDIYASEENRILDVIDVDTYMLITNFASKRLEYSAEMVYTDKETNQLKCYTIKNVMPNSNERLIENFLGKNSKMLSTIFYVEQLEEITKD